MRNATRCSRGYAPLTRREVMNDESRDEFGALPAALLPLHLVRLLAQGGARLLRQPGDGLLAPRSGRCLLDVPARRRPLLRGCHARRSIPSRAASRAPAERSVRAG